MRIDRAETRKILFVVPSIGMGEVVFMSMVVRAIRENIPGVALTFMSGGYSCAFLRLIPGVVECVALETLGLEGRLLGSPGLGGRLSYALLLPRFYRYFREGGFDLAVVSGRGRIFTRWVASVLRLAGTRRVVRLAGRLQRHLEPGSHVTGSYRAILRELGLRVEDDMRPSLEIPRQAAEAAAEFLGSRGIRGSGTRLVGICPLSTRRIKNWPAGKFRELMERLGQDPAVRFIVFAHGTEADVAPFRAPVAGRGVIVDDVPVEELMALIGLCDLFISVDTGPMHVASALGVPTLGIFGPTSAVMYGPTGEGARTVSADASGCRYFDPTFMASRTVQACYREDRCLARARSCIDDVGVDEVLRAALEMMRPAALVH